jgi:hypothetical protein
MDCCRQAVTTKKTLLQVAVETGFHSLVELLAKHENREASKNAALGDAVSLPAKIRTALRPLMEYQQA